MLHCVEFIHMGMVPIHIPFELPRFVKKIIDSSLDDKMRASLFTCSHLHHQKTLECTFNPLVGHCQAAQWMETGGHSEGTFYRHDDMPTPASLDQS